MLRVSLVALLAAGHSGVPRYTVALGRALDTVAPEFPSLRLELLTSIEGAENIAPRHLGLRLATGPFRHAREGPRRILTEQFSLRRCQSDLTHFFDLTGPIFSPRRPFVATIHDAGIKHHREGARLAHKQLLQPFAVRHARAIVAVSAFARGEAVRCFGADPARVQVIHSGPGFGGGKAPAPGAQVGRPRPAAPYVVYVGRLDAHKNVPMLIEAMGRLQDDVRLLIVAHRGQRYEEIRALAERSGAAHRIEFVTDAGDAELDRLLHGARALVLPSRYEGFGFTALEAMSRGCPVLASDIPALREVCGVGAWLLPVGDPAAWTSAIGRVARDGVLREQMSIRGRSAVALYSWEKTARKVCELFLSVGGAGH